jgi:PAS domain S-box-containing protein
MESAESIEHMLSFADRLAERRLSILRRFGGRGGPAHDRRGDTVKATAGTGPAANSDLLAMTIEELQVAEEELRTQSEELIAARYAAEVETQRLRALFDLAPAAYLVTDANCRIREANRAAATLLQRPQERLVGKPLTAFISLGERQTFRAALAGLLQGRPLHQWPVRMRPAAGPPLDVALSARVIHADGGTVQELYWIVTHDRASMEPDLL